MEFLKASVKKSLGSRPGIKSKVVVDEGPYKGRGGEVCEDVGKDDPKPFMLRDWDGTTFGPVGQDECHIVTKQNDLVAQQKKAQTNPRPTTDSMVKVISGEYATRAGVIDLDATRDAAPFTLRDWDGARIGPISAVGVQLLVERKEMAEIQIDTSDRPTVDLVVIVTGGPYQGRAGVIAKDNMGSPEPYRLADWDGADFGPVRTEHCKPASSRTEMAEKQRAQNENRRPVVDELVRVTSGRFVGRAGTVGADDPENVGGTPFIMTDWDGKPFGPIGGESVERSTLDVVAQCQIETSGRPTEGALVKITNAAHGRTKRAGVICKDEKGSEHPFTLLEWDGSSIFPANCAAVYVEVIERKEMAELQIDSETNPRVRRPPCRYFELGLCSIVTDTPRCDRIMLSAADQGFARACQRHTQCWRTTGGVCGRDLGRRARQ